jgi:hypothetical protein
MSASNADALPRQAKMLTELRCGNGSDLTGKGNGAIISPGRSIRNVWIWLHISCLSRVINTSLTILMHPLRGASGQ